jgi:Domain of unknown function (DUF4460)
MIRMSVLLNHGEAVLRGAGPLISQRLGTRGLSTESSKRISATLKKMMKPFFLKCHPDVQTSPTSRQVNMVAIQTLNGFMDTLDATCDGKIVDWPQMLPIEFLLVTEEITARKRKPLENITRRKVELVIPPVSLRDTIVQSKGADRQKSIQRLQIAVQHQLGKVLQIAGLPVPQGIEATVEQENFFDDYLENEVLGGHAAPMGRRFANERRPRTKRQASRERFMSSLDPERVDKMYTEALKDLEAHIATSGFVKNNAKLRQDLVNKIIAKVRIDNDAAIEVMDQLITLRRLSLIMEDNFEKLHMEVFGRMWEEMTIILTNPRDFGTSGSALNKRRKRGEESGFRFTYCSDNRVTIHIPLDFSDKELLAELDQHLWDWFNMVEESWVDLFG